MNEPPNPGPIRLCCGQRHWTVACPDGLVLCGLCFCRKPVEEMNILPDGRRENVCKLCAEDERRRVPEPKMPMPFWYNTEIHGWPMSAEYKEEMERRLKEYPINSKGGQDHGR